MTCILNLCKHQHRLCLGEGKGIEVREKGVPFNIKKGSRSSDKVIIREILYFAGMITPMEFRGRIPNYFMKIHLKY